MAPLNLRRTEPLKAASALSSLFQVLCPQRSLGRSQSFSGVEHHQVQRSITMMSRRPQIVASQTSCHQSLWARKV
ncbi:uncharacterized protein MYCGRDRAFT_104325 [Zymoseptoria tritici IPO323]|uniref:Uncharacterized protein n=1 Tax=Zymoseptoria tritici (strain CBS 115943 / IPO323) TaxID=336722 RepID=F9X975_ZYMTI|nr:uncharacterized protein MYCGRDRAFT_104325 [Zymoseptoria tritici IPO323]EGP88199.1 hypothetical protein MYCGRDRAFT_104325 [Zymoseptoria tritici IPO323]